MQFHQPDNRWPVFGCPDYQTFLDKYLVTGRFHNDVPEDVKKNYETIEHMMAFAWYHYPLYDEALNKLLRTFEMAIKLKCALLSISLTKMNKKGVEQKKDLVQLIKEVCVREPGKRQSVFLDHLRTLRNYAMHPDSHSYVGAMLKNKIILTVNILNILFASEEVIVKMDTLLDERNAQLKSLNGEAFAFFNDGVNQLVHTINIDNVFINGKAKIYLIFLEPVVIYTKEERENNSMPQPITLELKNPLFHANKITGQDADTGSPVVIEVLSNPKYVNDSKVFRDYVFNLTKDTFCIYMMMRMDWFSVGVQIFRYKHYNQLNKNSTHDDNRVFA